MGGEVSFFRHFSGLFFILFLHKQSFYRRPGPGKDVRSAETEHGRRRRSRTAFAADLEYDRSDRDDWRV